MCVCVLNCTLNLKDKSCHFLFAQCKPEGNYLLFCIKEPASYCFHLYLLKVQMQEICIPIRLFSLNVWIDSSFSELLTAFSCMYFIRVQAFCDVSVSSLLYYAIWHHRKKTTKHAYMKFCLPSEMSKQ